MERAHHETESETTPGQDPKADVPALNAPDLAPGDARPEAQSTARGYRDWRGSLTAASLLNLAVAAWLLASPFILDYSSGDSRLNPVIVGALVGALALLRLGTWRAEWPSAINIALGAWLFASGFWLAESPAASWNAWLFGIVVIVLALFSIDATEEGRTRGAPGAGEPAGTR